MPVVDQATSIAALAASSSPAGRDPLRSDITRAMYPTGALGDRFAREVVRAGRWAIERRQLRLELPGDAGVLPFTRQS